MRIVLSVEYAGESFEGWQTQPHGRTVQDALERALARIADAPVPTVCAGRTDTGVHATTQIAHFDASVDRPVSAWVRGVNSHLPDGVSVRWAQPVTDDFHARFSATARHYRYVLFNGPVRPALLHARVGWFHRPLDVGAMARAAMALVGEHDFTAFRAASCQAHSPVRRMRHARVQRHGDFVVFDFCADAFLHHMIRNLVGSLVYIGKGAHPADWMAALLRGRDRTQSAPTFSAAGLYLCGVEYPDQWSLPGQGRIICTPQLALPEPCTEPESKFVD
ncbi:MAG TPA: tRNA pseudouridine(38-40) synthase TruA [Denitromonas sp.]|uniref:tRNA pseudouridine(38-40) synthase TruA n=1 Tax=Denitromonas sp. TaxID=2734609 RepID=UPI001D808FB4|nr:tRNA pseudouridine(38-40) synthase TruA [Rhodocyclaceae bacterium]MCP5220846.1 tRNA pseudouridine(38-40) synthase TruA [Zoogloeaceae bacterium]HPR05729.1 tRNA pseudouridine(38-40) synthase TruA [Denitromonas sp.]HQU87330.1 tRNA pseudouridine(38-40) synthase TruA [Denitromonas sp.]HQV13626.1 tRNA pseudouridine(38-40) synthase TruA [Denitromonas sp.]